MLPHTPGMCCPFGPARIPVRGVSPTQHAACALWGHVCLTIKGVEVGGSCLLPCPSSPQNPKPETRLPQQRREATPASPPSLPPHCSSCLGLCWNVTGVGARACPDSRNTCFSPQGFPQPPALFMWMVAGRLFMPRRPPEVTASVGPCGGCCPRAAASLITGGGRARRNHEPGRDLMGPSV